MPADASIFQNFLRAPKSVQDYDNEAMQAQSNALAMKTQQAQYNALAQQQQDDQALRNYLAGGANLDTPEGQAGLYRVAPKAAGGILKSKAEIAKENAAAGKDKALAAKAAQELIGEAIKNSRVNLEGVTTPEQYIAWHEANHKDPVLGPYLESRGVTVDQARARINQAIQTPDGFIQLIDESKLGAEKTYANLMRQSELGEAARHNKAGEGLTRRGQDITASNAKAAREQSDRHFKETQAASKASGNANEGERNAAGYLMRMTEASKLLDQFEGSGAATYGTQTAAAVPFVGGAIRRAVMTPEQQQYRQAQEDWVRAKLRKESGASIATDEMDREIETYFPMPGEGKEVIAQKRKARATANAAMRQSSGRAATPESVTSTGGSDGVIDFGSLK